MLRLCWGLCWGQTDFEADLGINMHFFLCHSANLFRTINEYDVKLWWQGALVITFVNKKYVFLHLCSNRVPLECSQEFAEWGVGVPAQQVSQPVCQSISKILRRNFTFFLEISYIWPREKLGLKSYQWTKSEKNTSFGATLTMGLFKTIRLFL